MRCEKENLDLPQEQPPTPRSKGRGFAKGHRGYRTARTAGMNKTESTYATVLAAQKLSGFIQDFWYEGITLKLADGCRYTPDFLILREDGILECVEVKVGLKNKKTQKVSPLSENASKVKIKVAAAMYPFMFGIAYLYKKEWTYMGIGGQDENVG